MPIERLCLNCNLPIKKTKRKVRTVCQCPKTPLEKTKGGEPTEDSGS